MAWVDGLRTEELEVHIDARPLPLLRACGLAAALDPCALLGEDDVPEPPYWMHLWPGAIVLARRLSRGGIGPATRVLELGCGLALPAVYAARCGAQVVASDWKREPLALARASAVRNGAVMAVVQMDWAALALRGAFDLCLGADIAYDEQSEGRLVLALAAAVRQGGRAWLADSVYTWRQTLPRRLADAGFLVSVEEARAEDEGRPVWVRLIEAERR